jgi:hypothetical protein
MRETAIDAVAESQLDGAPDQAMRMLGEEGVNGQGVSDGAGEPKDPNRTGFLVNYARDG